MATYTRPDATYPAVAEDAVRTPMSPADVGAGWSTSSQTRPPAATFNARDYLTSSAVKYLLRLGVAEWSPTESYQGLGLCIGTNGSVYWNLVPCVNVNPVTDVSGKWEKTAIRRADAAELIGNITGGVIPETTNLLMGNGTGSAADSGVTTDNNIFAFPHAVSVQGYAEFKYNASGAATAPTTGGLKVVWNLGYGTGETDFINARGSGSGGFNWYNMASGAALTNATPWSMQLDGSNHLHLVGALKMQTLTLYTYEGSYIDAGIGQAIIRANPQPQPHIAISPGKTNCGISFGIDSTFDTDQSGTYDFWSGADATGAQTKVSWLDRQGNAAFSGNVTTGRGLNTVGVAQIRNGGVALSYTNECAYIDSQGSGGPRGLFSFRQCAANGSAVLETLRFSGSGDASFLGSVSIDWNGHPSGLPVNNNGLTIGFNTGGYQQVDFVNGVSNYGGFGFWVVNAPTTIAPTGDYRRLMSLDGGNGTLWFNLPAHNNTPIAQLSPDANFMCGNGQLRLGQRSAGSGVTQWAGGSPNINSDGAALILNGAGNGGVYLNWDQGVGGVHFGTGNQGNSSTAYIDNQGQAFLHGYLIDNGSGNASTFASYWADTSGMNLDGSNGIINMNAHRAGGLGAVNVTGYLNAGYLQVMGTAPDGQVLMGNGTSYVPTVVGTLNGGGDLAAGGARAFGVSYPNTNRTLFVSVTYTVGNGGAAVRAYIGAGSPSMLVAGQDRINAGGNANLGGGANYCFQITFIVPPRWFFEVTQAPGNTGAPTIVAWIENFL
jgi:hypothetical protein